MSTVNDLHHREHMEWLSLFDFYEDELKIFESELIVVTDKHPNLPSISGQVEEYKMFFNRKKDRIAKFKLDISELEHYLDKHPGFHKQEADIQRDLRERIEEFKSDFELLKKSFRRFASHND